MKFAILIPRILLGALFAFSGLNGVLHFIPTPPMPPSDAATFTTILITHNYMTFVAVLMLIACLLFLVGRFVPLALTLLGPILVNILLFHILLEHGSAAATGIIATAL